MRRLAPIALPALLLVACQQNAAEPTPVASGSDSPTGAAAVAVSEASCRPTLNGRDVTACHLTLTASSADRLVSVSAPVAGSAEIHDMSTEGGVMRMAEITDGLPLPAGEPVRLEPRGKHIMLMGVKQPLQAGDTVPLTLTFQSAPPITVTAPVAAPAA